MTIKTGQTHVQAYTKPLLAKIVAGQIDPSFVVTHPANLGDAPLMYQKFRDKEGRRDQSSVATRSVAGARKTHVSIKSVLRYQRTYAVTQTGSPELDKEAAKCGNAPEVPVKPTGTQ